MERGGGPRLTYWGTSLSRMSQLVKIAVPPPFTHTPPPACEREGHLVETTYTPGPHVEWICARAWGRAQWLCLR